MVHNIISKTASKINVIIPMAGAGKRFDNYSLPKPLIDVNNKPMIQAVIENLNIDANYIFIIQTLHKEKFGLDKTLNEICPGCKIVEVLEVTEGPACTALLAEKFINEDPLIIVNCDQIIIDFRLDALIEFCNITQADGILGAFISSSDKNSYMKLNDNLEVIDVKEKIVISNVATNGLHFWKSGLDFIYSSKEMIKNKDTYNGEYYVAPSYNYLIKDGKKIKPFFYNLHIPIGTPEDLNKYLLYGNY